LIKANDVHGLETLRERQFFQLSDFSEGFFERARNLEQWKVLAERFDTYQKASRSTTSAGIPKRIHQIWLGSRLPDRYRGWTDSWRQMNNGWEYCLWDEKAILKFGLKNEVAFRESVSFGAKSDIARYEILEREGGVYADTDFECLRPLDELIPCCSFFAGTIFSDIPEINNGLMGCIPKHPLLRRLVEQVSEPIKTKDTGVIIDTSGPRRLTRIFFDSLAILRTRDVIFPSTFFYPFPNFIKKELLSYAEMREYAREWSLAVHYWETSWARPHPFRIMLSRVKRILLGQTRGKA
jgi:mannosyltransferase OCH1-like enzyme